jgi:threonine dehydrogenase-like Zn-dependent dehydrogenase
MVLGHESAGIVDAVGPGVVDLAVSVISRSSLAPRRRRRATQVGARGEQGAVNTGQFLSALRFALDRRLGKVNCVTEH